MSTLVPISPQRALDALAESPPTARTAEPVQPAPADTGVPNPSLRLDPALGLVVMEFRDRQGRTETLPTEKELEAYRSAGGRPEGGAASPGSDPQKRTASGVETDA